jgi:hypothetical protein
MTQTMPDFIPAYEGEDMTAHIMGHGFKFLDGTEQIKSITNIRDTAIIITDWSVWRAKPCNQVGFCIELVYRL